MFFNTLFEALIVIMCSLHYRLDRYLKWIALISFTKFNKAILSILLLENIPYGLESYTKSDLFIKSPRSEDLSILIQGRFRFQIRKT